MGQAAESSRPGTADPAHTTGAGSEQQETAPAREPGTAHSSDAAVPQQTPQTMPSTGTAAAGEAEAALCGCTPALAASAARGALCSQQQVPPTSPSAMLWSDSEAAVDVCMAEDTAATPTKQHAPAVAQQRSCPDELPHQKTSEAAVPMLEDLCEDELCKVSPPPLACPASGLPKHPGHCAGLPCLGTIDAACLLYPHAGCSTSDALLLSPCCSLLKTGLWLYLFCAHGLHAWLSVQGPAKVLKEHAAIHTEKALPAPQTSPLHQLDGEPEAARRGGLAVKCSICSGNSLGAAAVALLHGVDTMCR